MGYLKALYNRLRAPKYKYCGDNYRDSFLAQQTVADEYVFTGKIPRVVYCFWTGTNQMSPDRSRAFELLRKNVGAEVVFVTPDNLNKFILQDYPLHRGYNYLSLVHRSDYLRCYFMHHYGGGYSDIKAYSESWLGSFDALEKSSEKWIIGYREIGKRGVAPKTGRLGADLKKYWHLLLGNGGYICKPRSPFTTEWYFELHRQMDLLYNRLEKNPGNTFGDNPGYPVEWSQILGCIFHPLCLKYSKRLMFSRALKFKPMSYR